MQRLTATARGQVVQGDVDGHLGAEVAGGGVLHAAQCLGQVVRAETVERGR